MSASTPAAGPTQASEAGSVSIKEKICYALGDVGNALAVSSVSFWLLIYLTDVAGLAPAQATLAMMLGRCWDAVCDPVVGWITDHTNSRWGKRRPYLFFFAVPYAVFYAALWMVPGFDAPNAKFLYITTALVLFNTCFAFVLVPYASLTAAITNDYKERISLTGFRMIASQSSFLVGAALPSALMKWVGSDHGKQTLENLGLNGIFGSWAGTAHQGYCLMAVGFGAVMIGSIWTVFAGIRERVTEVRHAHHANASPFSYGLTIIKELRRSRPFRMAVGILCLSEFAGALVAVNIPYFIKYVVRLEEIQTRILCTLFLCAIAAMPVWIRLARKRGKAETYRVVMIVYALVLCMLSLVGQGNKAGVLAVAACGGLCHAAALMIPWSMIPDLVEYDEYTNGERREGLFYGGALFCYKFATAMAVGLSGLVLSLVGYIAENSQPQLVLSGMRALVGVAPAFVLVMASWLASRYPLTAAKHHEIVAALEEKRRRAQDVKN